MTKPSERAARDDADGPCAADPSPLAASRRAWRSQRGSAFLRSWLAGITRLVVVLGAVSLFTDIAGEMIAPLRLLFLVQVLGTPLLLAGLIEGIAEGATSLIKVLSGRWADRAESRRGRVVAGYALSHLCKPLLALAAQWPTALGLVLLDRAGKAVRGSPRDALLSETAPPALRGKAFGFHRGADTFGAALGPLLALLLLTVTRGDMRAVFAWTAVPGAAAVLVGLIFLRPLRGERGAPVASLRASTTSGVRRTLSSPVPKEGSGQRSLPWHGLGPRFWLFSSAAACFALGNSSDAFLFLRSEGLEASLIAVPFLYFALNVTYALLATPLGALSDRVGRLPVLLGGYAVFTLVYLGWTRARPGWEVWTLFLIYGVYYAATDGVARAFVADLVPATRRGTALGWFNGLTGFVALPSNILGAWLWAQWGPGATFALGAWLGAVAVGLLIAWWPWLRRTPLSWPDATPGRALQAAS
jgi:MFS family permease